MKNVHHVKIPAVLCSLLLLTGCATLLNGVRQPVEVTADDPRTTVSFNGGPAQPVPATEVLVRGQTGQGITIILPGPVPDPEADTTTSADTLLVPLNRQFSHVVWLNAVGGLGGVLGMAIDFGSGAAWRLEATPETELPRSVRVSTDVDPWSAGNWHASLALSYGGKRYTENPGGYHGRSDWAAQFVLGHRSWPVEAELRSYASSTLEPVAFVLWEAGIRKSFPVLPRIKPFVAAGPSLLNRSTQGDGGFPVGVWARGGTDIRVGARFLLAPYLGYSQHELASASGAVNTGGILYGLSYGLMW